NVRQICRYLPLSLLFSLIPVANAQSQFDINMGFGAAQAKAASTGIESNGYSSNFLGSCSISSDSTCVPTSSLNSFMLGFGGSILIKHNVGAMIDFTTQPAQHSYANLPAANNGSGYPITINERTTFGDFDVVAQPVSSKRAALRVFGG